ncbi:MAG: hypothetical protein HOP12_15245 [Candidatus Eisenbacteria bacterium]|uniref:Uncharacterized protein n=1 Tax=Eiseniibacteriota bacterium TaxID=2212470 RepID=A0A849SVW7_UNCEI|nr:hypothetical protein [Candidatus Eisenbacteria bacterium]
MAPETWVTAAPFDTITIVRGTDTTPTRIPVRFHVYWAGSDQDGAVAGFFWAVTETLPKPPDGFLEIPNLPGPKPQDYHFTTATDTTFIFNVAEEVPDRQHGFFIYAVDNKGKGDPTPARFVFVATDRFPPIPLILEARADGIVYELSPGGNGVVPVARSYFITDTDRPFTLPRDTVPSNSRLTFRCSARPRIPGSVITALRYKLDEPDFVSTNIAPGQSEFVVRYNDGTPGNDQSPAAGTKIFILRAVDQAQGTEDSTRRFVMNFSPITWWAGPDLTNPIWRTNAFGEKFIPRSQLPPTGLAGSLLSPDSVQIFPAFRPIRRTFIEFYEDTLWGRNENDVVHMNAILIFHHGGLDEDSQYGVRVTPLGATNPTFPGGPVLEPSDQVNGSPIGFRSQLSVENSPFTATSRSVTVFAEQFLFPVYDPNDPAELTTSAAYWNLPVSGRAIVVGRAVDGDGAKDRRITDSPDAQAIVRAVDDGIANARQQDLRDEVLTFFVNREPVFLTANPAFAPRDNQVFTDRNWSMVLLATDRDPYLRGLPSNRPGRPSEAITLRRRVTLRGFNTSGAALVVTQDGGLNTDSFTFLAPANLAPGPCQLDVELCDCVTCAEQPGEGRCVTKTFSVVYAPTATSFDATADRPGTK